jgi:2-keto-4-pentenoate hydratase
LTGQVGRLGDHPAVLEQLGAAHDVLAVGPAERVGHAEAGRRQRLEAERLQQLGGAGVPRVGQDQDVGPGVPLLEQAALLCLRAHGVSSGFCYGTRMDADSQRELARLLADLRRDGRQQSGLDARLVPPDTATAYRIAGLVAEELGWPVLGWKIAAMKEEMQKALRTDQPIYGRTFFLRETPATFVHARLASPIPEVEYQARLGADLPPRAKPYSLEEVADAVASLHPGLELAECRFVHDAAFPPLPAILADGAGSGTIVYGPAIADWRQRDIANQEVTLSSDGRPRRRGTAAAALDHPMVPLTWLANELSRSGVGLRAGEMVSTGTLTGMLAPKPGEEFVADFGSLGSVRVSFS